MTSQRSDSSGSSGSGSWRLVDIHKLTTTTTGANFIRPTPPRPVAQEMEVMEAQLRNLIGIFEHLHSFHSWMTQSAHQLAREIQNIDPRVRGKIHPVNNFDTLTPKVRSGFLSSHVSRPPGGGSLKLHIRMNLDLAEVCKKRLEQTKVEQNYCIYHLEMAEGLVDNLALHQKTERDHKRNQQCILNSQI